MPGMMRRAYRTDLSDAEWARMEPHLPAPRAPGRPRPHPFLREILDAVFYVVRGGCTWRLPPHDFFPPWETVYHYFRAWRIDGTWERLHEALRRRVRVRLGRDPQPTAGIVDSQKSVKTTGVGGEERGYDPGKKAKGRKRHLLVDTQGLVLEAKVRAANVFDRDGIKPPMELVGDRFARLAPHLWLDAGYDGKGKGRDRAEEVLGLTVEVVRPPRVGGCGFPKAKRASACVAGFHGPAEEVGGGEDVLVDRSEPPDEQGLREADGHHQRGVRLRGYESLDGEAIGLFARLFGRFPIAVCISIEPLP